MDDLSQVLAHRRSKLDALLERGVNPYAYGYERSHGSRDAIAAFETTETAGATDDDGPRVRVGGRLVSRRGHGKTSFGHIEDGQGRIQVYFRRDDLGVESFELLELTDLGDWIGVEGSMFRTRTGEATVRVESWTLLSKSLRPLPFGKVSVDAESGERTVHSGFQDVETRYRQRYADLAVNPEVRDVFRARARIISELRLILEERGFLEVETPALQPLYGGAIARPFVTHHNALDMPLFLRIADELYLKRLIVGGFERVYEIAKDFRNEGIDRFHNPEFTMLEFYQAFADYHDMMDLVESLVSGAARVIHGEEVLTYQGHELRLARPYARLRLVEALNQAMDADVLSDAVESLRERARGLGVDDVDSMGRGKLIDKLFGELVQPKLIQPTFVVDHPLELSPLAKRHRNDAGLTERFELYIAGEEVANAFSELNDPVDQRSRFEAQVALRAAGDDEAHQVDEDYIRALEYGMPPTGGVGIGVDRLVMLLTDQASIRDVLLFPTLRPEDGSGDPTAAEPGVTEAETAGSDPTRSD